jgi:hypothetical protein
MSLYVDTSALLKRYVEEPESAACESYLLADPVWITGRHTLVELRRNLPRLLEGAPLAEARAQLGRDWQRMHVVELDEVTCNMAADMAELTGARTLDALHLAAASRVGTGTITFLTFDIRQAQAARTIGMTVVGV